MGLDMYLYGERFLWHDEEELKDKIKVNFPELDEGVDVSIVRVNLVIGEKLMPFIIGL